MKINSKNNLTYLILFIGFLVRFCIPVLLPRLTTVLDKFVLFSTPVNSNRSLKEGIFLLSNNLNPYKHGEIIHHPPIVLEFFKLLNNSKIEDGIIINLFFATIDILIGFELIKLNDKLDYKQKFEPYIIAIFYCFNPFSILSTLSKSTYLINNLILILMMNFILIDKVALSIILVSISTYLTYYGWYLMIPIVYYTCLRNREENNFIIVFKSLIIFLASLATLFLISYKLSDNSFNFIKLSYGIIVKFDKIAPNLGLWWYFFTEIFEFFKNFYLSLFNLYSFMYILPVTIRFIRIEGEIHKEIRKSSIIFTLWIIIGITNFSKSYPILTDYCLFYSMIILFKQLYSNLKYSPVVIYISLLIVLLMSPIFYFVWMGLNSGNSNFFYAIGLVLNLLEIVIVSDFLWSKIQIEYYEENNLDFTKESLRLTQI